MNVIDVSSQLEYGGSAAAVQFHYDVGREFYALWLDNSMTYSSALWNDDPHDTLQDAQRRKIDHHLNVARVDRANAVLDIGCGWGGLALELARNEHVEALGVTLSREQLSIAQNRARSA